VGISENALFSLKKLTVHCLSSFFYNSENIFYLCCCLDDAGVSFFPQHIFKITTLNVSALVVGISRTNKVLFSGRKLKKKFEVKLLSVQCLVSEYGHNG